MFLTISEGAVPSPPSSLKQILRTLAGADSHGWDGEALVLFYGSIISSSPVVSHHPEHVLRVPLIVSEGTQDRGHLSAGRIGLTAHYRGDSAANSVGTLIIVRDSHVHQKRADVAVTQTQCSVFIRLACDFLRRELSHQHANLKSHSPQPDAVSEIINLECLSILVVVVQEVDTRKVTRGVV